MTTEQPTVELFFDVVSPYAYLCFVALLRLEKAWGFKLILTPAFLADVMKASGNQPPWALPAKGAFIAKDIARNFRLFNVKLSQPKKFPLWTIRQMRCLVWIQLVHPEKLVDASRIFWEEHWGKGEDITTSEAMEGVMKQVVPGDDSWKQAIQSAEIKQKLQENTQRAIDSGAFGFPWMLVTTDLEKRPQALFGSDRFAHLAMMLGKEWNEVLAAAKSAL